MKTCYVMVGLPATGKSTLGAEMREINPDAFVYSTDIFIEECAALNGVTYDDAFTDFIEPATKNMNERVGIAIRSNQDIIWDQTNLTTKKRSKIINRMKQAGYRIECHCIRPPGDSQISDQVEWKNRLNGRPGKTIPQNILTNMIESFTVPSVDEGFDMITFYNMHGAALGIDYGVDK